ncbi:MAG: hypothetical protein U0168_03115 [Nannocystaceae bacterium]
MPTIDSLPRWLLGTALLAACGGAGGDGSGGSSSAGSSAGPGTTTASTTTLGTATDDVTVGDTVGSGSSADSTGGSDACATPYGDDPTPLFERPRGRFELRWYGTYTSLVGAYAEAPPPDFHQEAERSGACRLLTYEASVCNPVCEPPGVCIDGACVTASPQQSLGAVTLAGIDAEPIAVNEDAQHTYFWDREAELSLQSLGLDGEGGAIAAFSLGACAVAAPQPEADWSAQMMARAPGESVVLRWTDPVPTARIYMRMTTGIGTHGGISPVEIECEGPDVGELELPGAYLDALYADGWACGECGGNDLLRYHADHSGDPGELQFRVGSIANFWYIP